MNVSAAVETVFAGNSDVVVIEASGSCHEALSRIRASAARFALVIVGQEISPVDRAMILASVGPLAVELGPDRRIGALDIGAGARQADILETARFLVGAESTTGQVLAASA
ncbi:hypothetical protein ASG11_09385 [Sphingomonas sp. Leaf357]|uniref:Rossmann fold domain-containing protein n=1 Tax=Sphingomonas sp. Leaf357 TaxID=1736350 RepID=UPI000700545B|nr:hypothetical protein [Sphingomonas sp. Leaf357]KQS04436.1 hypothetical protein ASG11_09385 [Sphingomonas sp. Leaf357]